MEKLVTNQFVVEEEWSEIIQPTAGLLDLKLTKFGDIGIY